MRHDGRAAAVAAVLLLAAAESLALECISVLDGPSFFEWSTAVFIARWDGAGKFHVETPVRGDVAAGDRFAAVPAPCRPLVSGGRYIVTRRCSLAGCGLAWNEERYAPSLIAWLDASHPETSETVIAQAIRWYDGALTDEEFYAWIDTAAVQPLGDEYEEGDIASLERRLRKISYEVERIARCAPGAVARLKKDELRDAVELMRRYPPWDAHERGCDAADPEDDVRGDLGSDLMQALRKAFGSEDALRVTRECPEVTSP